MSSNGLRIRTKRARSPSPTEDDPSKRRRVTPAALAFRPRNQTRPSNELDTVTDGAANYADTTMADTPAAPAQGNSVTVGQPINNTSTSTVTAPTQPTSASMTALTASTNTPSAPVPPPLPTATELNIAATTLRIQAALEAADFFTTEQAEQQFPASSRPLSERITRPDDWLEAPADTSIPDDAEEEQDDTSEDDSDGFDSDSDDSQPYDPYEPDSDDDDNDSEADDKYIGSVDRAVRYATEEAVAEASGADTTDRDEQHVWAGLGSFAGWLGGYQVELADEEDGDEDDEGEDGDDEDEGSDDNGDVGEEEDDDGEDAAAERVDESAIATKRPGAAGGKRVHWADEVKYDYDDSSGSSSSSSSNSEDDSGDEDEAGEQDD